MSTPEPVDLGIERLVHIDRRIDSHEGEALRDRWEFGHAMLAARDGAGRLPNGYLAALVERTGRSRTELKYRTEFAVAYPTEAELVTAVTSYRTWTDVRDSLKRAPVAALAALPAVTAEPAAEPGAPVSTIVADPPWRYGNTSTRGAAEDHYPTMSIQDLCDLDVARDRAADKAHLYLWTTAGHLPEAFTVMDSWGFEYKTYLVWVKPQMGMGNYFRVSTELVLFGIRGEMRTQHRGLMNHFTAKRGKHSAKPLAFRELVKKASPGPYLELFSRCRADQLLHGCECSKCTDGWEVWGNQS